MNATPPSVIAWLRTHDHPLVRAAALTRIDGVAADDARVARLHDDALRRPDLRSLLDAQHVDGSWGMSSSAPARIVPTLMVARSLVEVGLSCRIAALARALDFLMAHACTPAPTTNGRWDGALACYAGMLAAVLMRGGRADAAAGPLAWIVTHQQVHHAGVDLAPGAATWGSYLAVRHGGCFASTTCFVGVMAAADALEHGRRVGLRLPGRAVDVLAAARTVLEQRRVCFTRSGDILPLASATKADPAGTRWVVPTLPRHHLPDLFDLLWLARRLRVVGDALVPAIELANTWRRADGRWVMAARREGVDGYRPERASASQPSAWVTLRAIEVFGT